MRHARHLVWLLLSLASFGLAQNPPNAQSAGFDIDSYCASVAKGVEHGDALMNACGFALSLKQRLPNFTCDETMTRYFFDPSVDMNKGSLSKLPKPYDTVTMRVRYENSREEFSDIKRDGQEVKELSFLRGAWSEGEFGSFLRGVFSPESSAKFRFKKRQDDNGVNALVFEYRVQQKKNTFWLLQSWGEKKRVARPGIVGELWLDESTSRLLRFKMEATSLDDTFPMQDVKNYVTYAEVPMGDGTKFVLPVSSTSRVCSATEVRKASVPAKYDEPVDSTASSFSVNRLYLENRMQFTNCHKFGVDTRILPTTEPVEPTR